MVDIDEAVLDAAAREKETLTTVTFVELVERAETDRAGVGRDRLRAYAEAARDRRDVFFDYDAFREQVAERLTDEETWVADDTLYALDDDRLSRYPAQWHEELGGSTDVAAYVDRLRDVDADFVIDPSGAEAGPAVSRQRLLGVIALVGRTDLETARAALEEARTAGEVVLDADQNPNAGVYLPEDSGDVEGSPSNPR